MLLLTVNLKQQLKHLHQQNKEDIDMKKFTKRNTVVELDINGDVFSVNFARDDIPSIFALVSEEVIAIGKTYETVTDIGKRTEQVNTEQKLLFKEAINDFLQDNTASERIFKDDNSAYYHAEVYNFLVQQYAEFMSTKPEYSPERVQEK